MTDDDKKDRMSTEDDNQNLEQIGTHADVEEADAPEAKGASADQRERDERVAQARRVYGDESCS